MADPISMLEVCAGVGGFALGLRLADRRIRTVGYIERDPFCAAVLLARMEDETLERAPVFCGDLRDVDGSELRGEVDLITAGFPCQPFSPAGKKLKEQDDRWIWPDIKRLITAVEPAAVFLENVSLDAFRIPFGDLRDMGFELPPPVRVGACDVGAPHRRYRFFALAHRDGWGQQGVGSGGLLDGERSAQRDDADGCGEDLCDAGRARLERGRDGRAASVCRWPGVTDVGGPFPPRPDSPDWQAWDGPQPGIRRDADGTAARVDRLRALGNAVMPQVVAAAWQELHR